jgi:site-specific DNA recombinase
MLSAVVYCRVSTKDQVQNLSLETQQRLCRSYCEQQGWQVDEVFVDEGESAKTADRPQFQNLLNYCRVNKKKIGFVVVYAISRFARTMHDYQVVRGMLKGFGIALRSVTEPINDTSAGKFMENVIASAAQYDNDVRSERTIEGMSAALRKGRWTFPLPIGYRRVSTLEGSVIEHDPERAPLVKMAFELYASGRYQREAVRRTVTAAGLLTRKGEKLSSQSFSALLQNPRYVGRLDIQKWGVSATGEFEPIVSEDVFERVQLILAGRRHHGETYLITHPDFPLRHFVRCDRCDRPLTGSWSKGRTKRYPYYRCAKQSCKSVNSRKELVEQSFLKLLRRLQPHPSYMRLFREIVQDVWKQQLKQVTEVRRALERKLEQIADKKNRLVSAFLYEKKIDKATYEEQLDLLRQAAALAEMELHDAKLEEFDVEGVLEFANRVMSDLSRFWLQASLEQKIRFQKVLFPKGLKYDGEKFGTAPTCYAFSYLREISSANSSLASRTGVEPVSPP